MVWYRRISTFSTILYFIRIFNWKIGNIFEILEGKSIKFMPKMIRNCPNVAEIGSKCIIKGCTTIKQTSDQI